MKGDFTRDTFDPSKNFLRVLMQQGRVQLDADWNEQVAILLNYMQTLAQDVIGPHGGPGLNLTLLKTDDTSAQAKSEIQKVAVADGHYYVQGRLVRNAKRLTIDKSKFQGSLDWENNSKYFFYLDAWERHITYVEDELIREKALNGPDTTTRSQLVWQVRVASTDRDAGDLADYGVFLEELKVGSPEQSILGTGTGELIVVAAVGSDADSDPCIVKPGSRYRGMENQLYRVEIHSSGYDETHGGDTGRPVATWKWSRDNGAVVFPIRRIATDTANRVTTVTLENLGNDARSGLNVNDCVEIVDDEYVLSFSSAAMLKVKEVREDELKVILHGIHTGNAGTQTNKHPILRRWDHQPPSRDDNAIPVQAGQQVELEDGIKVEFRRLRDGEKPHYYRAGDYWLIPARVATGDVEWPRNASGGPEPLPPRGIQHSYAPLAHAAIKPSGEVQLTDLRKPLPV